MNYLQMAAYHRMKDAQLTIAAIRVRQEKAAETLGVIEVDQNYRLVGFEEKPVHPKTIPGSPDYALGSMGIYIFKVDSLIEVLQGQEEDFGKDIIPKMISKHSDIFVYDYEKENRIRDYVIEVKDGRRTKILVDRTRDSSYWKDVGSIDSYYEASMDLVGVDPYFNLYGEMWPIRTYQRPLSPSKCILGGKTPDSIICDGCIISGGTVWNSIISPGVIVERDALVERAIIFDDVIVEPGARVRKAIIDKEAIIRTGASIGYDMEADGRRGCVTSPAGVVVVPRGMDIGPIYPLFG
jgi:glucose-1-phosphate adenylyltransferase